MSSLNDIVKDKKLIDYTNFANDTIVLFKIVNSVLKISNSMKESDFIKAVINKLKGKNIFINVINPVRLSIFMQIIITVLETVDYQEKRDFTATNLTLFSSSLIIIGGFVSTPLIFVGIVLLIARGLLESSELVIFLNRTILAVDRTKYRPYFLNEAFKNSDKNIYLELATPKELITYIGENYKDNKDIFNLAFKNELQFLYTTLVGMKLEIDEKYEKILREKNSYFTSLGKKLSSLNITKQTNLKIPKILIDDSFKLFLDNRAFDTKENSDLFIKHNDDVLFDLYRYYDKGIHTIILKSSMVNLKYEFEYKYSYDYDLYAINKNPQSEYYEIKNFKQT
uniref:hypothetical protein n=2 Tax=Aliarcobacter faecis TaxID=1564138 RepID=UPI00211D2B11